MYSYSKFKDECLQEIKGMENDKELSGLTQKWRLAVRKHKYPYHFEWLGRPIIQYPQDIVAVQELIWAVKPDLIIETGIAHGGSLILSASMLALIDMCEALEAKTNFKPASPQRRVVGIDIDIRPHNYEAITAHPLLPYIHMIEGSSTDENTVTAVKNIAKNFNRIMVFLDSMHTHSHVLTELEFYAPLVSVESYCICFDTIIEHTPLEHFADRPWCPGNNPKTAVWEYLKKLKQEECLAVDGKPLRFEIDKTIQNKLLITVAPDGYLRRIN